MSDGTRQKFVLEIDSGSKPISGRLTGEGRGPVEFGGWLGLAAALEGLIEASSTPSPQADRRGRHEPEADKEKIK